MYISYKDIHRSVYSVEMPVIADDEIVLLLAKP